MVPRTVLGTSTDGNIPDLCYLNAISEAGDEWYFNICVGVTYSYGFYKIHSAFNAEANVSVVMPTTCKKILPEAATSRDLHKTRKRMYIITFAQRTLLQLT
jgi:hypothetical protein